MGLDDVGSYKCEVKNTVRTETLEAEVTISGLGEFLDKFRHVTHISYDCLMWLYSCRGTRIGN